MYTLFVTLFIDDGYGPLHPAHHVWFAWLVTSVLQEALEMHEDGFEAWVQKGFNGRLDFGLLPWSKISSEVFRWSSDILKLKLA